MSRDEYLWILQSNLKNIPYEEAQNIIEYYREYFDEAGVENTDKVMRELGTPQELAKKVCGDYAIRDIEEHQQERQQQRANNSGHVKKGISNVWFVILAFIGFPVWGPLAIAVAAVIFSLVVVVFSLIFAFFIASVAVLIAGVFGLGIGFVALFSNPSSGVLAMGTSLICIGLGILFFYGVCKLFVVVKSGFLSIAKKRIRGKKNKDKSQSYNQQSNGAQNNYQNGPQSNYQYGTQNNYQNDQQNNYQSAPQNNYQSAPQSNDQSASQSADQNAPQSEYQDMSNENSNDVENVEATVDHSPEDEFVADAEVNVGMESEMKPEMESEVASVDVTDDDSETENDDSEIEKESTETDTAV